MGGVVEPRWCRVGSPSSQRTANPRRATCQSATWRIPKSSRKAQMTRPTAASDSHSNWFGFLVANLRYAVGPNAEIAQRHERLRPPC
eukprot:scaffold2269_cov221-Pinguiococcus_pyrenoidosus.AAC.5